MMILTAIAIMLLLHPQIIIHKAKAQDELPTSDTPPFYGLGTDMEAEQDTRLLFYPWNIEPLDEERLNYTIAQIRLYSEQFQDDRMRGQIGVGLVQGHLLNEDIDHALIDAYRITDPLWLAKSLIKISQYLHENEQTARLLPLLYDSIAILRNIDPDFELNYERSLLLELAASLLLSMDMISEAIDVMNIIPDDEIRISALQKATMLAIDLKDKAETIGKQEEQDVYDQAVDYANSAIQAALDYARALPFDNENIAPLSITLINALIDLERYDQALAELDILKPKIYAANYSNRDQNIVDIAAAYIQSDDPKSAMEIVRDLSDAGKRARALAVVARARADIGDFDAASPLFILAQEEAERVRDNDDRVNTYNILLESLTRAGRLADAFEAAGKITQQPEQGEMLANMARILLERNQYEEARLLTTYIPQMELRAPILIYLARMRGIEGEAEQASQGLIDALAMDEGEAPSAQALPAILRLVLTHHTLLGSETLDAQLFDLVASIIDQMPDGMVKIDSLIDLAMAQAETEQLALARQTANAAYRIAFDASADLQFPEAMEVISYGQSMVGDLLAAFDTASRTPLPPTQEEIDDIKRRSSRRGRQLESVNITALDPLRPMETPRFKALARIAAAAGRVGETEMALRSAMLADNQMAQANGLAAIAIAAMSNHLAINDVLNDVANALEFERVPSIVTPPQHSASSLELGFTPLNFDP